MAGLLGRTHNSHMTFGARDDHTKENVRPKLTRAVNTKRSALGNVTNHVRRQPQRVVKGKGTVLQGLKGQENDDPIQKGGKNGDGGFGGFSIFEDSSAPVSSRLQPSIRDSSSNNQENLAPAHNFVLSDAVVNLHRLAATRRITPLAPLDLDLSVNMSEGSPMIVDESTKGHEESRLSRTDEFGLEPYFDDIYCYLRAKEISSRPSKDYMNRQSDVTTSMRNILVDWLVEVGEEYKLQRETLFLSVSYIDKFLSLVGVSRPKLQLVGTTCMFIASKYEEIYPPDVAEFVYITDDTYTRSQVLKMESAILKILDFKVAVPTINWFLERFLDLLDMSDNAKFLSFFLSEMSLVEVDKFLDFRPSVIAASCIVIARGVLEIADPWPKYMEQISRYSLAELRQCVRVLFSLYGRKDDLPQKAVLEKYKQPKFGQVASVQPPLVLAV